MSSSKGSSGSSNNDNNISPPIPLDVGPLTLPRSSSSILPTPQATPVAPTLSSPASSSRGFPVRFSHQTLGGGVHVQPKVIKYIYEIPFFDRKELARVLDENNEWERLGGGVMGYSSPELAEFGRAVYRGASPAESLLTSWGNQNHTILELFILLRKIQNFRGMRILAKFVEPKYHAYIKDPELNATCELIQLETKPNLGQGDAGLLGGENPNLGDLADIKIKDDGKKGIQVGAGVIDSGVGGLPQIPYEELLRATGNWDRRNILGKGGFGTVFKGVWKNTAVAIKRMEHRANQIYIESQLKQSLGELKFLNSYRHDNILPLYGYCLEGDHPCLVYQFMSNGSLEDRLLCRQRNPPLNWTLRYQITRGIACGIQFLHSIGSKPLIHGDIKSANILLDRFFEPKVGDFGLAREMSPGGPGQSYVKVSRVHGTRPYLPDEYLRSKKLSTKVDTFSFGIMLFEIVSGQRAYEETRAKKYLKDMVEEVENAETLRDPKGGPENQDFFWILLKLGKACTLKLARDRPEMVAVLKSLDGIYSQAQAASHRTISSHVTGLPLLFETPNSRAASLLPTGASTNRLSPIEMRAGSPGHWPGLTNKAVLDSSGSSLVRRSPLPSLNQSPIAETPTSPNLARPNHENLRKKFTPIILDEESREEGGPQIEDNFIPLVVADHSASDLDDPEENNSSAAPPTIIPLITELGIKDD